MPSYFSPTFLLIFLPLVIVIYSAVSKRARWIVLLAGSYVFFWSLSSGLIAFILISTGSVYLCGRAMRALIEKRDALLRNQPARKREIKARCKRLKRYVLAGGIVFNLLLLVALKYLGFFSETLCSFFSLFSIKVSFEVPKIGVPIGISFYTLMAISYLVDVYRESVRADKNIGRIALFLSFFPQIMEGPICRYGQTAFALTEGEPIHRANLHEGVLRILFGLAKKIVVADRLNVFIKTVFNNYETYDGGIIAIAAILYTVQLYCDFSGTMDVAIGIGRIFNVNLPENFRQPFFSRTASEFWMRWHITLGTWFKDYVFYPISLSKPCKKLTSAARKSIGVRYGPLLTSSIALICVWVGNGLWHGAGSQYLFFGIYYFVMIMGGGLIEPVAQTISSRLGINRDCAIYRAFQIARTLVIIFVGELFFRANGLGAGIAMFKAMVTKFSLDSFIQGTLFTLGIDAKDCIIVAVVVIVLLVVGIIKERGCNVCTAISSHSALARWSVCIILFFFIVIFGAYGANYTPVPPMYAQF